VDECKPLIAGIKATPVPPQFLKDRAMERLFAGYCFIGAGRATARGRAMLDERRFLRLLKEAGLLGKPKVGRCRLTQ
jgi:hypothetical protein